ncbi:arrestin homolog [Sitophilus oryzae]|uniref:Arrestin homolog n=1 Tax=Sitophilus oryzae TaxID=7048 RepID=A0A6J2YM85_SITOR|nr:arrestin homolog [Sitophilus oryzae]
MTMDTDEASAAGPSTAQDREPTAPEPKPTVPESNISTQRVFKKSSPNNKLTMYLSSRDLVVSHGCIDRLIGVLLIDPEFVDSRKVYGQITLTFRYGREDEEVMGLKFCNEAVMCLTQLYPPPTRPVFTTPLQEALLKRLGSNAYPFTMEITPLAPPSVQLVPAKEYNGAPIGTSYDVRAYVGIDPKFASFLSPAERMDEKLHKRTTVRMGIRVVQRAFAPPSPYRYVPGYGGRTTKEQAKFNRKALLFGCKSAPLDNRFFAAQGKSRSVEAVTTIQPVTEACRDISVAHHSMPECRNKDTEFVDNEANQETTPNHNSGGPAEADFDKENNRQSPTLFNGTSLSDHEEPEPEPEPEMLPKSSCRRASKMAATRSQSVESNEDRICDHYRSLCSAKRPSLAAYMAGVPNPKAAVEKPFMLSDGKVFLSASLDKAIYSHGEEVRVSVHIRNNSTKTIRRIKVFIVQHVDVCMFSNGKFKNVVAIYSDKESCPIHTGETVTKTYTLLPLNTSTKNWIALEDTYTKSSSNLASTVCSSSGNSEDRNVFAIYVSYYVKVKLLASVMGGDVSLKLPFTLMHTCTDYNSETLTRVKKIDTENRKYVPNQSPKCQRGTEDDIKPAKDGT